MMNKKDNLIFLGTAEICLPFLELLKEHFNISLIITQPDTMGGRNRKQKIIPASKTFALANNIEVIQPETLNDDTLVEKIKPIEPFIGIVIAYGKLIPGSLFMIPQYGTVNVHFSLLPYYRGAVPVQRALENGDTKTGITIFEIAKKMDAGDIWAQKEIDILPADTTGALWERMSQEGAPFLIDTINKIIDKKIHKYPQDHEKGTEAPMVRKEEGIIDWKNLTAQQIYNKFRAFTPWPGICFCSKGKTFKMTKVRVSALTHDKQPGDILSWDKQGLKVGCSQGTVLEVLELQPPGKKTMTPYCYCMGNELPDCLL